jgi:hypothetical protein
VNSMRWIASSLLGAAAFAAVALPSRHVEQQSVSDETDMRVWSASTRMRAQIELWRRADSRAIAIDAARRAGRTPLWMAPLPERAAGFARRVRKLADAEFAGITQRDTAMRVVLAFAIDTGRIGARREVGTYDGWSTDVFVPSSETPATCTAVVRVHSALALLAPDTARLRGAGSRVLGACAWYGVHGAPGRGIANWLDSTEHSALIGGLRPTVRQRERARRIEMADWAWGTGQDRILACIAGKGEVCDQLVLGTSGFETRWEIPVRTPGWAGVSRSWYGRRNEFAGFVLTELERQIGTDGFRAFWKSDLDFPDAFAAARGESLSAWVERELTALYAPYHPGPLPSTQTSLALLVALPGSIALGLWAVRRRESFA